MLTDPLSLGFRATAILSNSSADDISTGTVTGNDADLAIVDVNPTSVVRKGRTASSDITMTVSHSPSKENGKVPSSRVLVRFDERKFDDTLGQNVVMSGFMVLALPSAGFTLTERQKFAVAIIANLSQLSLDGNLNRIINGEG